MQLGEGARQVGQPCWSHAQCRRSQEHSHCTDLICTCNSGFHNHGGRCSRNFWEDLGLQQWELLLVALVITLVFLAIFMGCMYFFVSKLARRYRQTIPADGLVPSSFQGSVPSSKINSIADGSLKSIRVLETQLVGGAMVESQMVERKTLTGQQGSRELVLDVDKLWPASLTLPATQFILPLDYQHNTTDYQPMKMMNGRMSGQSTSSLSRKSSNISWSSRGWESLTTDTESELYNSNRRQFRAASARRDAGKTYRPLLLRTSTFSESDESP
ncbi:uncharacterized protein LOC121865480 isoform X2 [Homarus americanus]|uniref:uncharacterized protein LOC121865480 isoform X2 n=1 Tax=Homarus americanus TaxID=6706 RepID=UPI001C47385C|nr:uncharacterized protein LOC121865480 isoform X2 [Homarus americanus]